MMKVNWDDAPEWATHYSPAHGMFFGISSNGIMRGYDGRYTHEYKLIERPKSDKCLPEGREIVISVRGYKCNEAVVQYDCGQGTGGSSSGNGEVLTQDQNEREEAKKG